MNRSLANCGYPQVGANKAMEPKSHKTNGSGDKTPSKCHVIHYIKGTSEAIRQTFSSYGVSLFFKPTRTSRHIYLVSREDKTEKKYITGPIYYILCQGQTSRGQCKETQ